MMITDTIREVKTEEAVYLLLTAYVEAVRSGSTLNCLSEPATGSPFTCIDDVSDRLVKLIDELEGASERSDDRTCEVIKDALDVFGTALARLRSLDSEKHQMPARAYRTAA